MKIEMLGKILASGFGDKVFIGVILGFLDDVTPMRVYEYIRDDGELAKWVTEGDWAKYRQMAKSAGIGTITTEDIIEGLRKHRNDLLGVIINVEGGKDWLQRQVDRFIDKLNLG